MTTEAQKYPLVEVIQALRNDLEEATNNVGDQAIRFKVNEIEVELQVAVEEARKGEGGFNFSVLKFGGSFEDKNISMQTITLKLEPRKVKKAKADEEETSKSVEIKGKARRIS